MLKETSVMPSKGLKVIMVLALMLGMAGSSDAGLYTFNVSNESLSEGSLWLDHNYFYTYYMKGNFGPGEKIVGANLTLWLKDTENPPDRFWINLIDPNTASKYKTTGDRLKSVGIDSQGGGNNFSSWVDPAIYLTDYSNIGRTLTTKTYDFSSSPAALVAFNEYALGGATPDGAFAFGFDPDCHFSTGFELDVYTSAVPEPGTLMLLGSGLIGLAGYGRKRLGARCKKP